MTRQLFDPSSILVVGASTNPGKAGYSLFENAARFGGETIGLGRERTTLHDRPIVTDIDELDRVPDLAVLAIPPGAAVDAVERLGRAGTAAAIVCAGGFAESGPEGRTLQQRLVDIADATDIRVLGPNTSGIVVPARQLFCSFVPSVRDISPGPLGVVAQSGGVAHSIAFASSNAGVGISAMVGVGNAADLGIAELAELVADLPDTTALALHVEGLADGRALLEVVDRLHRRLPVIVLKAGRSDVDRLATSHTGALTGDWATATAMLSDAGAVVVETHSDLIDAAAALTSCRLEPTMRPGVGIVTGQAGPGLLLVDRLQELGVHVPTFGHDTVSELRTVVGELTHLHNPVDTGRPGPSFAQAAEIAIDAGAVDVLAMFALIEPGAIDLAAVTGKLASQTLPVLIGTGGPRAEIEELVVRLSGTVPVYDMPDRLATGVWALCRDATLRALPRSVGVADERHREHPGLPSPPTTEATVKAILAELEIASPARVECGSRDEAVAALRRLGTPVAVKVASPTIAHKARAGGVHLDVSTVDELDAALDMIDAALPPDTGGVRYLLEEMAGPGHDLIIGARQDASWGTVVVVGAGGTDVEEAHRVSLHRAPVSAAVLGDGLSRAELNGDWATAAVLERVASVANTLADLIDAWPGADTIELNPARIIDDELIALDALVGAEGR